MTHFVYKAIDDSGKTIHDVIEAESIENAQHQLETSGLIPLLVTESKGSREANFLAGLKGAFSKVKTPELIIFTKQLSSMFRAGIPIIRILQILAAQTENLRLKTIIQRIAKEVEEGGSLYESFKKYPDVFSHLYCSTLQSGEISGNLPEVLDRLIYIIGHEHKIKSDIRAAMFYPIIVLVFLGVAFIILLTFVIPKFITIFIRAKIAIPLPTRICMVLYDFLSNYWYLLIIGIFITIVGLKLYFKTEQGRYVRDTVTIRLPLLGNVFIKAAMSRFASIFAILQASGVSVLDTMDILSGTIGNTAISRQFMRIKIQLEEGKGIAEPLNSAKYFTPMVISMVSIGEESGNLEVMLSEITKHYDSEVEYAMDKLASAIGPLLTILLAAVVGFFALAIFLPMWDLTKMV